MKFVRPPFQKHHAVLGQQLCKSALKTDDWGISENWNWVPHKGKIIQELELLDDSLCIVWDDEKSEKNKVCTRPAPCRYGRTASLSLRGQRLERCENSVRLPRHSPDNGAETSCISTKSSPFVYFVGCRLKYVYIYIYTP